MPRKLVLGLLIGLAAAAAAVVPVAVPAAAQDAGAGKNVLMVLWRGITEPEVAFKSRLAALGVKANYTEIVGDQDRAVLAGRVRALEGDFEARKYDVIYSFGTTTTQVTQQVVKDRIPIIFNIVFDPVGSKLVKSLQEPGVNATGVTNGVPMADQLSAFNQLAPMKKLAVLFNAREPNANIIEKQVIDWATRNGVAVQSVRVAPAGDLLDEALRDLKSGKVDADTLYAGADSFLGSKADVIQAAIGDKIRLFGGTQTFVMRGWLGAFTPPVEDMGGTAAEMVSKVLAGQEASRMAVILPTPKLIISSSAAARHGVTVPAGAILEP